MTTKDEEQKPAIVQGSNEDASPEADAIAQRMWAIIQAAGGCNVESDDDDLWFRVESGGDLQIRLSGNREMRCYDRSTNFAISYGGQRSNAPVSSRFRAVVERIKAIDTTPLAGLPAAFRPAAQAVVRRLSNRDTNEPPRASAGAPPGTQLGSESPLGRALNVIFLDLCLQLAPLVSEVEALPPLHWGFWPIATTAAARTLDGYDPQEAFSVNLLSHVPEGVTRILDVGCGLGCNARILSGRGKQVTAVSPVPHHCAIIADARLPAVEVRCARFEDMSPDEPYDLLLFSESVNHFLLNAEFMRHCCRFLTDGGFMLMADDLSAESVRQIEEQQQFRILATWDITQNVAPTIDWFAHQLPTLAAYQRALMAILEIYDPPVATRVAAILDSLENSDLKALFSGSAATAKGRYMIFLLQRATPAIPA